MQNLNQKHKIYEFIVHTALFCLVCKSTADIHHVNNKIEGGAFAKLLQHKSTLIYIL